MLKVPTQTDVYKRMIDNIQDYAIILLDEEGYIQSWNKGAEKIKHYSAEDVIGKHFSLFYLPHDRESNLPQRLLDEARQAGRTAHEGWRMRKDGTKFWGSVIITAIYNEDAQIIGFCKVTGDLTDKKMYEDRIRMSEERYHNMIAEVQDYAIIYLNTDGVIENWNAGAEHIKGYRSHEIIGKKFEIFYTEEDKRRGLPYRLLNQAKETGRATHEGWRLRKDGTRFWGNITITALHNKEGEVTGYSKVTRDLTERKEHEDRLARYAAELEIQNSELEQFAYVASHDLQEPIRKIQIFSELIKQNAHDSQFINSYIDKLNASAKRMKDLVHSLLNYGRLVKDDKGGNQVDLNALVADVKQDLELLISEKQAVIDTRTLPLVRGNATQLGQLFFNLISNSLKFCKSVPQINISVMTVRKDEIKEAPRTLVYDSYYKIDVADNGIGFEDQYKKQIFSLFQRLHGRQDYEGTGIGLALCKKVAENHEGFITAVSHPGQGATFSVYLPVSAKPRQAPSAPSLMA